MSDLENDIETQSATPSYQWQVSSDNGISFNNLIDSPNSSSLTLSNIDILQNNFLYRVIATSGSSTITSRPAKLQVIPDIYISDHPSNQLISSGNATFDFVAFSTSGSLISYQWETALRSSPTDFSEIPNATGTTLPLTGLIEEDDGNRYRAKITSYFSPSYPKTVYTNIAQLEYYQRTITITRQPEDVFLPENSLASFTVVAASNDTIYYQWQESSDDGITYTDIDSLYATTNTLYIDTFKDQYRYRVILTAGSTTIVSDYATAHTQVDLPNIGSSSTSASRVWGDPHISLQSTKGTISTLDDNALSIDPILFFYLKDDNNDVYKVILTNKSVPSDPSRKVIDDIIITKNGIVMDSVDGMGQSIDTPSSATNLGQCTVAGVTGWDYSRGRCISISANIQQLVGYSNAVVPYKMLVNSIKWACRNKLSGIKVLLISTGSESLDNSIKNNLSSVFNVTTTSVYESFTNNGNILANIDVVLLPSSLTSSTKMPLVGQRALLDYISLGGGLVTTEWTIRKTAYGHYDILQDAFPVKSTNTITYRAPLKYIRNIPDPVINSGMSKIFNFGFSGSKTGSETTITEAKTGATIFYHSEQCLSSFSTLNTKIADLIEFSDRTYTAGINTGIGTYHQLSFNWMTPIKYSNKIKIGGALYLIYKTLIKHSIHDSTARPGIPKKLNNRALIGRNIDGYSLLLSELGINRKMLSDAVNAEDDSELMSKITDTIDLNNSFWKDMSKLLNGLVPNGKYYSKNTIYFTKQPSDRLTSVNSPVSFESSAISSQGERITYQWYVSNNEGLSYDPIRNGYQYRNQNSPILTVLRPDTSLNNYLYRLHISSPEASPKISNTVRLSVTSSISVSKFPSKPSINSDGVAKFDVTATSSDGTLRYQWQYSNSRNGIYTNLVGENSPLLNIKLITYSNNNSSYVINSARNKKYYRVKLQNNNSLYVTNGVLLDATSSIKINRQPTDTFTSSGTASFSIDVTLDSPLANAQLEYVWQQYTNKYSPYYINIPNSNSSTLTLNNLTASKNKYYYRVIVYAKYGTKKLCTITSKPAQLSVSTIYGTILKKTASPTARIINNIEYIDYVLDIYALSSAGTLTYQWQQSKNGGITYSNIPGAISRRIIVKDIPKNNTANYKYRVIISNPTDSITVKES